jgi:hypothetical protein
VRIAVVVVLVACACSATQRTHTRPSTGAIAGLARDHDSGDPVSLAEIRLTPHGRTALVTSTRDNGLYDFDELAPGTYDLRAVFAGQPVEIANIGVRAGIVTMVDITFTLGRPDPIHVDYGNEKDSQIDRYKPKNLTEQAGMIEGTVNDTETRERVAGAVITAIPRDQADTQMTVSDDRGRFRFEHVRPGVYSVSAYYSMSGRGQIEVLRNGITVGGAEAVIVPLWIEMTR